MNTENELFGELHEQEENGLFGNEHKRQYEAQQEALCLSAVISSPVELEPVLAEIEHINELGLSKWYEVVYFDGNWRCYAGSKTFKDGEKVIKWKYCKDCL